ncbi:hypothetical protein [Egicoccus sp. AB-alg2]|uniref:hypothetical protein n=1 Tax=Egicoccus sp. AB-alg2 TaxID=3242693 RepID=UPI00359DDF12
MTYHVVAQARFSANPDACAPLAHLGIFSISSVLRPDCVVVVEEDGIAPRVVAVDAKKRQAAMDAGDVAEAASKYVWGLRRSSPGAVATVAVDRVVVAAPAGGGPMFDQTLSRIEVTGLAPGAGSSVAISSIVS